MKRKLLSFDGYLLADVATVVTIVLFLLFLENDEIKGWFSLGIIITGIILTYSLFLSKAHIDNQSGLTLYVKDEDNESVSIMGPGQKASDIDGVKVYGTVYKIPDGVHAIVMGNHTIKIRSIWGRLIYNFRGGVLTVPPDKSWEPLFQAK